MIVVFLPILSAKYPPRKLPVIIATLATATITPIYAVVASIVTARDLIRKITAEPETMELANVVKNTITIKRTKLRDAGTFGSAGGSAFDMVYRLVVLSRQSAKLLRLPQS